jgi:hypothetical protein
MCGKVARPPTATGVKKDTINVRCSQSHSVLHCTDTVRYPKCHQHPVYEWAQHEQRAISVVHTPTRPVPNPHTNAYVQYARTTV